MSTQGMGTVTGVLAQDVVAVQGLAVQKQAFGAVMSESGLRRLRQVPKQRPAWARVQLNRVIRRADLLREPH